MINLEINSSPTKLATGNKRLTKVPIAIIIGIVLIVLFAIFYAALVRKQNMEKQHNPIEMEEKKQTETQLSKDKNTMSFLDSLEQNSKKKIEVPNLDEEKKENEEVTQDLNNPTKQNNSYSSNNKVAPLGNHTPIQNHNNDRELQIKNDLRLKALTSSSKLEIKIDENSKKGNQSNSANNGSLNNVDDLDPATAEFMKKALSKGYLQQEKQKPISNYEIKAGWTIPATLITGLNSDLAGEVLAQVSENIYDTATGKYLLIPQGTKIVGNYSSNVIYGQERILTAWTKLIFPNGDTLNLEGMGGTSKDGYSGFKDQVDNHYFRIFGSAFLLSSITAGIALTDNSGGEKETNSDKAMSQAINQMSTVASEMIRKNMNISPTLEIRPGYKFNIFVTKDIILEPLSLKAEK